MLLLLFLLFALSSAKISIHQTKETADLESTVRRYGLDFVENSKNYAVFDNWKTGKQENRVSSIVSPDSATDHYPGLISVSHQRLYDSAGFLEISMCAESDLIDPKSDLPIIVFVPIVIGESKTFENGTVKVSCARSDKGVSRVSEAVSGCYFNETVYPIHEQWTEPNPKGNFPKLKKHMRCEISEEGYFESKLMGCSVIPSDYISDWRFSLNSTVLFPDDVNRTCVETEPGVVQLLEGVENDYKAGCLVDNVFRKQWEMWQDDMKGGQFQCVVYGEVSKQYCTPSKNQHLHIDQEVKLRNGCTFLCHPQTNIFKCDKPMEMFKIVGKPRKMRQHKDFMFARRMF